MDKIENRAAFNYIRYANCWEDTEVLIKALKPASQKRYLSIASAGDNSLALLASGASVVALDLNPVQLACVEIRREAIKNLEYQDCLAFLGIKENKERLQTYTNIRNGLSINAQNFWDNNKDIIKTGLVHGGKFERYFQTFRKKCIPLIHSKKTVQKLLQKKTLQEQSDFYENKWANWRWHLLFKIFFGKFIMGRMGRDPEFFKYVDGPVSTAILKRAKHGLTNLEINSNPYLNYIFTGNFTDALPHYLEPEMFKKIRQNIDSLQLFQGSIQDALAEYGEDGFDGYNLSDIFEYLDEDTCQDIYAQLIKYARPKCRFAYWNMLVPRQCPDKFKDKIHFCEQESSDLFFEDKAVFYSRFIVEELR